ncbi:hypothetical protein FSP39_011445 [Pinctada imbricata]|uniref:Acyltransferase 3 domain-containing protein n=1 Tax=Pinctada imbricata TaxID=66713 RepID=A0AA88XUB8_PINIB|nr:hypothetical protein FSP39_011445 [Pinctada imbricata]
MNKLLEFRRGLLLAYLTLKELEKKGGARHFNWPMFYFHRFWRLTPPYMLILLADVGLYRYIGDGPYWSGFDEDNCKKTWWWNLLYINNFQVDKMTNQKVFGGAQINSTAPPTMKSSVILGIIAFLVIAGTLIDFYHKFWPMFMPSLPRKEFPPKITETSFGYSQDTSPLLNDDKKTEEREPGTLAKLFISFSFYSNGKKLLNTSRSADSLTAVNGMRFLSISWVVLCHAYGFVKSSARNVRSVTADFLPRWTFQAIANAYVSVDSFFALSGLLLAYLTMKELEKKGSVRHFNWPMFYFHRFWRLTPPYMLIMLADMALLRYVGEGPYWKYEGPNTDTDNCKETWWWNLLYINNFQLDKSCFGHAWYLANDMQFFVLSPLMLIPLFYNGVVGICVCFLFLLATCITTGVISSHYDLPPTTFSSKNSDEYFRYFYVKPWCRIGPYVVGIIFGYLLHKMKGRIKLNKVINLSIWTIVAALAIVILYGLRDYIKDFTTLDDSMETAVAALYNATHRTLWGVCVCWVIFAYATGHGGFVNTLLSWEGFVPLARLSYCVYLVHIFVFYAYIMDRRLPIYLDDLTGIYIFLGGLVLSNLVAFVCSLMFEAPMLGLEKIIFKRGKQK